MAQAGKQITKTKRSITWNCYYLVAILLIYAANLLSIVCALDESPVGRDATADKPQSGDLEGKW